MKKTLSLILAVIMLLGCMSVTAFAADNNTTEITATVANPLSYDMVIPQAVSMTEAGVKAIGTPSVQNVKHATANTVISYTATGTQLTLENSDKTMTTSYYTDSEGETAMPSTAIEVYKNKDFVDPLTTLYVGVTQTDWNAAENGTYKATVTFNFAAEEKEEKTVTAADALEIGAQFRVTGKYSGEHVVVGTYERINSEKGYELVSLTEDGEDVSGTKTVYCELQYDSYICFADSETEGDVNFAISIYADSNKYDPVAGSFIRFEVQPAGETEFTAVELTQAETA